jgi:hypothetical protein
LKIGGTFAVSTACCDDSVIDYIGIKERGQPIIHIGSFCQDSGGKALDQLARIAAPSPAERDGGRLRNAPRVASPQADEGFLAL